MKKSLQKIVHCKKRNNKQALLFFIWLGGIGILVPSVLPFKSYGFDLFINSSRYISIAGTGVASTTRYGLEDFGLINPANLSSHVELAVSGGIARGENAAKDISSWSVAIIDSVNGSWGKRPSNLVDMGGSIPLASMFYYSKLSFHQLKDQYFHLALSQPLGQSFSFGLFGNYSILEPLGQKTSEDVFDMGVGTLWKLHRRWVMGVTALHIFDKRHEIVPGYLRSSYGLGLEFLATSFVKFKADIFHSKNIKDQGRSIFRLGVSNQVNKRLFLQLGFSKDEILDTHIIAAGLAIKGPRLSISYGFRQQNSFGSSLHSIDFRLPLW